MPATPGAQRTLFVCSCEDTMPVDGAAIGRACGVADVREARFLCRTQLDRFQQALGQSAAITVACTQEAPIFEEVAEESGFSGSLLFANIRENAGWSREAAQAMPKMAALLAAAAEPQPAVDYLALKSEGALLIYGRDETALAVARTLSDRLDVTVLLERADAIAPPRLGDIPIFKGRIRHAQGYLGAFTLTVDAFSEALPSSRSALQFGASRNGAVSNADLVLDLSGGAALFPAHDLRAGYVRANPADAAAVAQAVFTVSGLAGTFDKPRYIQFTESLCAHERSKKTGCTRCLDVCPTGAITPNGNAVLISAEICAGCGSCASVCPTGAASYALPPADALMRQLRTLLAVYTQAGGKNATVLFHDEDHGTALIEALARFGDGLPAHVLPVRVNEITQIGFETIIAALGFGASAVRVLARAKPQHDIETAHRAVALANTLAMGLHYGQAAGVIETDDPDQLLAQLRSISFTGEARPISQMLPLGDKRSVMKQAVRALHAVAPAPVDIIALPEKSPFGAVVIDSAGCTLCLACVSSCPTGALGDNPDKPQLTFTEDACVQCGLCAATCPEKVITLQPRMNFKAINAGPVVMKEEEPFHCITCSKPFGTKSTIERVIQKLQGAHWMFSGADSTRIDMLKMCDDCRVGAVTRTKVDPYTSALRPAVRTTEDYLRERDLRDKPGEGNA
ncbi:MAG: 4Fe-4S binding protein [Beijerinckiaceae bacterium]